MLKGRTYLTTLNLGDNVFHLEVVHNEHCGPLASQDVGERYGFVGVKIILTTSAMSSGILADGAKTR